MINNFTCKKAAEMIVTQLQKLLPFFHWFSLKARISWSALLPVLPEVIKPDLLLLKFIDEIVDGVGCFTAPLVSSPNDFGVMKTYWRMTSSYRKLTFGFMGLLPDT